jgi:2-polyprenyl-6-hydroxyphenyl methylase/3-demethylubiquinone-9 3-methyltransferase
MSPLQPPSDSTFEAEVEAGQRFRFGRNWKRFLKNVNEEQIEEARLRLAQFLGDDLNGRDFLDIGSGSGLHSLAARRMGARVTSFDFDPDSVAATSFTKAHFASEDTEWAIGDGSVLDTAYLSQLGQYDIVYSWGVLHHTGAMWEALENTKPLLKPGGQLYIAIYNDRGETSQMWLKRKQRYCSLPKILKPFYFLSIYGPHEIKKMFKSIKKGKFSEYFASWTAYKRERGMTRVYDMIDWLGGLPYEFASVAALTDFYEKDGFKLEKLIENSNTGCHELLFRRAA